MDIQELKIKLDEYQGQQSSYQSIYKKTSSSKSTNIEQFNLITLIGRGTFGKVILCEKKDTLELYAIKCLKKDEIIYLDNIDSVRLERKILERINHPFVISLDYAFQNEQNIFLAMKFMQGGELLTHIKNKISEQSANFYASQILLGLDYLYKLNILYRDLKPENILMDSDGYIAITDFGTAKFIKKNDTTNTMCGTPQYLPPEVIQMKGHNFSSNWWCLGILIYEMIFGMTPFASKNIKTMYQNICENPLKFPNNIEISQDCINLITSLLQKNPKERLGYKGAAKEIKKHPWFRTINFNDLLEKKQVAPYIPNLKDSQDLSYFNQNILQEPIIKETLSNKKAIEIFDKQFKSFTYDADEMHEFLKNVKI